MQLVVVEADPQGRDALSLLRAAAVEARGLYPELHGPNDPWPTNGPTPPRGANFVAYLSDQPVAMGAHRPLDARSTELRRMFTLDSARRCGAARAILLAVEQHARSSGFTEIKLETGYKQLAAMALYESMGYERVQPFGVYKEDPTSVCYAKPIASSEA